MYGFPLVRSGIAQPQKSGFLQIPPPDRHPCFWLTLANAADAASVAAADQHAE